MTSAEFAVLVDDYQTFMREQTDQFLRSKGIKPDWNRYWQLSFNDHTQIVRDLMFFAGGIYPDTEPEGADLIKQAA